MSALTTISSSKTAAYGDSVSGMEEFVAPRDKALDRTAAIAMRSIGAAAGGAGSSEGVLPLSLSTTTAAPIAYHELTRRIPKEHMALIEARMSELSKDAKEVDEQITVIKRLLSEGAYELLPENYYYYGLLGVQKGTLSTEQFSILIDYLTLTAQGIRPVVAPLFYTNEEGKRVLNLALADSMLGSLIRYKEFSSKEEGYDFLQGVFQDLPAEALQVQVYEPSFTPTSEVPLPEGCDPLSFEARLIRHHDTPVGAKIYQLGYSQLTFFLEGDKWKRLSVTTELYQRLLDHVFQRHAVKINPVLGDSSIEDIRRNGRSSTRDQGMPYITPSTNEKGYEYHCIKIVDSYPVDATDFRDHDRYHAWICSILHKELIRSKVMHISDFLARIGNLCSYLREKDPRKQEAKVKRLATVDPELASYLESGLSKEQVIEKCNFSSRARRIIERLLDEYSGDRDLKALRHISWSLCDMELIPYDKDFVLEEVLSEKTNNKFALGLINNIYEAHRYNPDDMLADLRSRSSAVVERAKKIVYERIILPDFTTLRVRYEAEMLIYEEAGLAKETVRCIRTLIHRKDEEPSYKAWLSFRNVTDTDFFDEEDQSVELFSFMCDLTDLPMAAAGAGRY